ncbi:MAG: hypothetical protein EBS73_13370 [Betaproteobacteria bacterium]|nr:hypothetical protein [Betaproteobacteria bacterium]
MNVIDKHPMPLKTWRRLFLILWAAVTLVWIILLFKSLDPFGASRVIYDFWAMSYLNQHSTDRMLGPTLTTNRLY